MSSTKEANVEQSFEQDNSREDGADNQKVGENGT